MFKAKNKTKKIVFKAETGFKESFENPKPAKRFVPDWYKKMQTRLQEINNPFNGQISTNATIKACAPVLDYLTGGYIIPIPFDLKVNVVDGKHNFIYNVPFPFTSMHAPYQIKGAPFENKTPHKITNPWFIETPKGYSCFFFKPYYADTKGIDILPAIVDTDNFHEVNFPFFFTETEDGEYFIPRGTPIAQVLPFKRDEFEMEMCESTHKEGIIQKLLPATIFKDMYKTMFRVKKSYR